MPFCPQSSTFCALINIRIFFVLQDEAERAALAFLAEEQELRKRKELAEKAEVERIALEWIAKVSSPFLFNSRLLCLISQPPAYLPSLLQCVKPLI